MWPAGARCRAPAGTGPPDTGGTAEAHGPLATGPVAQLRVQTWIPGHAATGHTATFRVCGSAGTRPHRARLPPHRPGPSSSAAPPASKPVPRKPAAPGTPAVELPRPPPPPPPAPSSEDPGSTPPPQAPDPHLLHQMGLLLKQMQDVRALLGHLVTELRNLSGHLKLETVKGRVEQE